MSTRKATPGTRENDYGSRPQPNGNGAAPSAEQVAMAEALAHEQGIADEATAIRGEETLLTPKLFMELWPLLKRPIPQAFIKTVGVVTGKPYDSTGIRSVQVQIDRMNNVLTPMWWHDEPEYSEGGKLCKVTVSVDVEGAGVRCTSYGGVDRGSTLGNVYKGSYTNAAKRAFAAVGPGHEVYIGATDLDPDVHEKAAEQQARTDQPAGDSPLAGVDPAELEARADAFACAKEIIAQGIWNTQRLKAEMVSAKAADTSTVGKGIASIPFAELEALHSKMVNLLPPVTDEPAAGGEKP